MDCYVDFCFVKVVEFVFVHPFTEIEQGKVARELLGDSAGDHFVGFSGGRGSDQRVEGENTAWRRRYFWRKESLPASEE